MLALLAAASMVKLAYSFPVDLKRTYDVQTSFEGFLPLLGGHEGRVEVALVVTAVGQKPDGQGNPQVLSTLDDIKVVYNRAPLTFVTIDSAKDYFPPTTISMNPFGETLKTNAPDLQLPIKLPGLDIKRFPDITYLPLELPKEGAEVGKAYTFKKAFGDSDVIYSVTPTKITEDEVDVDITFKQAYDTLENEGLEVVTDPKEAVNRVHTEMSGKGSARFDPKRGVFTNLKVSGDATGTVTDLSTKKESERKLQSTLEIKLRK